MSGPTYTYTANIPQPATPFNQTTSGIRENFQAINELIGVNHVTFNNSTYGIHNFVSMPNQTSSPGTSSTEIAMFTAVTGSPNPCEIFVQSQSDGALTQISNTSNPSGTSTIPNGTGGTGWCQFDSGLIYKWGTATVTIPANTGNFGTSYSFTNGPDFTVSGFWAQVSLTSSPSGNDYGGFSAYLFNGSKGTNNRQSMTISGISGGTYSFNWIVIGY